MNINMLLKKNGLRTAEYEMKLRKEILILCEILIIAAFIYTYIVYGISRPDKGEICIYDNILYSEYYGFEMILLIFLLVIIQADLRSSHRCAVIIRYKSIRHYWNNICKNITAKCMEMTSILLINIIGLCIILKIFNVHIKICNWDMENSRFRFVSGYTMEKCPSVYEMAVYLSVQIFSILFITVIISQIVYWISSNKSIGMLASIIWVCLDRYTYLTKVLFSRITMMPGQMVRKYGIGPVRCLLYPALLCLIIYIISLCIVQKKDIMYKE